MSDVEWRRKKAEEIAKGRERRLVASAHLEVRDLGTAGTDGVLRLTGLACRTGVWYPVGDWMETVARGAFKRSLSESPDVVLNLDHGAGGTGLPLARTTAGTLRLSESDRGLEVDADLDPEDVDTRTVKRKLDRGDLDGQMSMAFVVTSQKWDESYERRTITALSLARGDVSLVVYGANDLTEAEIRARQEAAAASSSSAGTTPLLDYTTRARQELDLLLLRDGQTLSAPDLRRIKSRRPASSYLTQEEKDLLLLRDREQELDLLLRCDAESSTVDYSIRAKQREDIRKIKARLGMGL